MTQDDQTNKNAEAEKPTQKSSDTKVMMQKIWGFALVLAGIGVFFRIPQVMPQITENYPQFAESALYIKFCFYLLGVLLVGGGAKKLYIYFNESKE